MERAGVWPLGLYCERTVPGLWGEPLNTVSNVGFLLAALVAFLWWRRAGGRDRPLLLLVVLTLLIGVGSTAFHAAPSRITLLMDVLPIQLFIVGALWLGLARLVALPGWLALGVAIAFLTGAGWLAQLLAAPRIGGSAGYLPGLAALMGMAGLAAIRGTRVLHRSNTGKDRAWGGVEAASMAATEGHALRGAAALLGAAAVVFLLSLTLRTLDRPFCASLPMGLHFLWHLLNAAVLALILRALMPRPSSVAT